MLFGRPCWAFLGFWVTLVISGVVLPSGGQVALEANLHPVGSYFGVFMGLEPLHAF